MVIVYSLVMLKKESGVGGGAVVSESRFALEKRVGRVQEVKLR